MGRNPKRTEWVSGVPEASGVYALFSGPTCIYVGSSLVLYRRLICHPLRRLADTFSFVEVPAENLVQVEQAFTDLLRPTLNRAHKVSRPRLTAFRRLRAFACVKPEANR